MGLRNAHFTGAMLLEALLLLLTWFFPLTFLRRELNLSCRGES